CSSKSGHALNSILQHFIFNLQFIALVPCTMQLVSGGVCAEASVSLRHVGRVLQAMSHRTALHHVITATCYVTDSKSIPVARSIWQKKLRECKKVAALSIFSFLGCLVFLYSPLTLS
uniref:Uncharacterized protein n=1 Tax=Catharus ustulatus TaxID=91951 RepID=A0A8C3UUN6_CATUS